MKVSSQYMLAVHTMLMTAHFADGSVTSERVAESAHCNPVMVRKAFAKLRAANLIVTRPGRGRTDLARPADEITLWDIYGAVMGTDAEEMFRMYDGSPDCPVGSNIRGLLDGHFGRVVNAIRSELSGVTLADLAAELEGSRSAEQDGRREKVGMSA